MNNAIQRITEYPRQWVNQTIDCAKAYVNKTRNIIQQIGPPLIAVSSCLIHPNCLKRGAQRAITTLANTTNNVVQHMGGFPAFAAATTVAIWSTRQGIQNMRKAMTAFSNRDFERGLKETAKGGLFLIIGLHFGLTWIKLYLDAFRPRTYCEDFLEPYYSTKTPAGEFSLRPHPKDECSPFISDSCCVQCQFSHESPAFKWSTFRGSLCDVGEDSEFIFPKSGDPMERIGYTSFYRKID